MAKNNSEKSTEKEKPEMPDTPDVLEDVGEAMILGIPGALPIVGPSLSGMIAAGLNYSYKAKMHKVVDFVLEELEDLRKLINLTPESTIKDEQFNTYLTRAVWQAVETHEEEKLRALASAAVNSGSWSPIDDAEREYYWRLLRQYTVLHLQTLRALHSKATPDIGIDGDLRLEDFFKHSIGFPAFHEDIGDAVLRDLSRDGLTTSGFGRGYVFTVGASDLSPMGGSFLDFLNMNESAV